MGRGPRKEEWEAITARVSPDSAKRLRIAAARRGVTTGIILDEVIQATLPADKQPEFRPANATGTDRHSIHYLKREMIRLGLSQGALSRLLGITQKAVNLWFQKGNVPEARWKTILESLEKVMKEKVGK